MLEDLAETLGTTTEYLLGESSDSSLNTFPPIPVGYRTGLPEPAGTTLMNEAEIDTLESFRRLISRAGEDSLKDLARGVYTDADTNLLGFAQAILDELRARKSRPNIHLNRKP